MGQYYHPTIINLRGHAHWLNAHWYNNGLKLMEHSYLGNNFCNAVLSQILNKPMRIAWMGDYALDDWNGDEPYQQVMPKAKFRQIWNRVYGDGEDVDKRNIRPEPLPDFKEPASFAGWYLVNHTKHIYIDIGKYAEVNKWRQTWKDYRTGESGEYDMCINPLPLLTACGNGCCNPGRQGCCDSGRQGCCNPGRQGCCNPCLASYWLSSPSHIQSAVYKCPLRSAEPQS